MKKLIVVYNLNIGEYHRDGECRQYVNKVIQDFNNLKFGDCRVCIAQELLIHLFRCAILDNKIKHDQLIFEFNSEQLKVDRFGNLSYWPVGFCDFTDNILIHLVGWDKYEN